MTDVVQVASMGRGPSHYVPLLLGKALRLLWPAADAAVVISVSILAGLAYHAIAYGHAGPISDYAKIGAGVAFFRWALQQPLSSISNRPRGSLRYEFHLWNVAFLCILFLGFVSKISDDYSRGTILLFYFCGLPSLLLWQAAWKRYVREGLSAGRLAVRQGLLLGTFAKIEEFRRKYPPSQAGMIISDVVVLPEEALVPTAAGETMLKEGITRAIELVRLSHVDDVVILLPWSATRAIDLCADRLMTIPASVQLGPEPIFERFSQIKLTQLGPATMINLIRPPLTRFEILIKRLFDACAALTLLILLLPVLLTIALLIKLDSRGPVLFRQHRRGFNQGPFRIFKFRTMTVAEDGDVVIQAIENDPRVTRVGRYLRRWNLDELPQLVNVLMGDMSLVGPRPHAWTHDRNFAKLIALYARRHNIKPGITGWAQVNGWRGATDTEEKIRARVEHDLYYIDNWSMAFDLYILALTVVSPKSFRNAH